MNKETITYGDPLNALVNTIHWPSKPLAKSAKGKGQSKRSGKKKGH